MTPPMPSLVDFRHCLSDSCRRAVNEAVLDAGASGGQVALRDRDAHAGLAIDSVAQRRARLDHRLEGRNPDALRLGVGLGDEDISPYPAAFQVSAILSSP